MTFYSQPNTIRVILNNVLALPSFIMAVNSVGLSEAPKSASIHHKSDPYDSSELIKAFLK